MTTALDGRAALVTGASRGIGKAIAERLARGGATVVLAARTLDPRDSSQGSLRETAEGIAAAGGRAVAVQADLSLPADRARLMEECAEQVGGLDILVNNAAVAFLGRGSEYPEKRYRLMFELLVHAPFDLCQRAIPTMRERGAGWILNISSIGSVHPLGPPYATRDARGIYAVYGMCKAALERMSTGLAAELHADGVAVNSLAPWGWVPTPGTMVNDIEGLEEPVDIEDPAIIAEAAAFLCSADPTRVTGRITYSQPLLAEFKLSPRYDNARP
jgi:citronellol/citronellal dehydrogenase